MGSLGYTGPKPPVGDPAHRYHFQVFALNVETLGLEPGAKRDAVLKAMEGHVLAEGQIVGTFERKMALKYEQVNAYFAVKFAGPHAKTVQ